MRTRTAIIAIITTAVLCVVGTYVAVRLLQDEPEVVGPNLGALQSTILGERREYFVYLPENYATNTNARYPVLYVLDGGLQAGHSAESASLLARIGVIPRMIVVGIPNGERDTRDRDLRPPTNWRTSETDHNGAQRFLLFLEKELIPKIEADYRTARPRMLAGWSLGGTFVLYSLVAAPALFDGRFAHSSHLWGNEDPNINQIEERLMANKPTNGFLYLSLGDQEADEMKAPFGRVVRLLETISPQPTLTDSQKENALAVTDEKTQTFRWRSDLSVGGGHNSNPILLTPVGLCAMFSNNPTQSCRPQQP